MLDKIDWHDILKYFNNVILYRSKKQFDFLIREHNRISKRYQLLFYNSPNYYYKLNFSPGIKTKLPTCDGVNSSGFRAKLMFGNVNK